MALALVVAVTGLVILGVPSASAHRSGCHRWHTCPSDSGCYVVGQQTFDTCGNSGGGSSSGGSSSSSSGSSGSSAGDGTGISEPYTPPDVLAPDEPTVGKVTSARGLVAVPVQAEAGSRITVTDESGDVLARERASAGRATLRFRSKDGTRVFLVTATDAAGNASLPADVTLTVDGTPPKIAGFGSTPGALRSPVTRFAFRTERAARWAVTAVSGARRVTDRGVVDEAGQVAVDMLLRNGSWRVTTAVSDQAGNVTERASSVRVAVPRPTLRLTRTSKPGATPVRLEVTGPARGSGEVTLTRSGGGTALTAPLAFADGTTNTSVELPAGDGVWTASAHVSDVQHRAARASLTALVVDTAAPTVTVAVDPARAKRGVLAYTVTTEPAARVEVTGDVSALRAAFVASGPRQLAVPLGDGDHRLRVRASDQYGNTTEKVLTVATSAPLSLLGWVMVVLLLAGMLALTIWLVRLLCRLPARITDLHERLRQQQAERAADRAFEAAMAEHRRRLEHHDVAVRAHRDQLSKWRAEGTRLEARLSDARTYQGEPAPAGSGGGLKRGERVFLTVPSVQLVEPRKSNGIARDTVIDTGAVTVTNLRVLFSGSRSREWSYAKLTQVRHSPGESMLTVTNRQRVSGCRYPRDASGEVQHRLNLALAHFQDDVARYVSALSAAVVAHRGRKPTAPQSPPPPPNRAQFAAAPRGPAAPARRGHAESTQPSAGPR